MSSERMIERSLVVARQSNLRPFGGSFLRRIISAWRTPFSKRGPIDDHERMRSMLSITMTLKGDLYASS